MTREAVSMHELICMRQTAESYQELLNKSEARLHEVAVHCEQIERRLFEAQTAAIGLAHKVKMYETALEEIAWSNNSAWQQDRAKQALVQMRGVEL